MWLALCLWGNQGVGSILPLNVMVGQVPMNSEAICTPELGRRGV